jgi:asparagine N-glycosylation enzyme membrane subunit Stt3
MANNDLKEIKGIIRDVANNKKLQITLTIILFLILLYASTAMRLSNLPVLKDATTGKYISNDLDSLYFYREAQALLDNNWHLPAVDALRAPAQGHGWINELVAYSIAGLYKIEQIFSPSITFDYSAAIYGPIVFAILLVIFFMLCWALTRSKLSSLVGSAFLAFSPAFLFRSVAGFYDHDGIGVLAIIISCMVLVFSFKKLEEKLRNVFLRGILFGLSAYLVLFSWGGGITFLFIVAPLASLIYYLCGTGNKERFILFYLTWVITYVLSIVIFGYESIKFAINTLTGATGFAVSFMALFFIIDWLIEKYKHNLNFFKKEYLRVYSFGMSIVLGLIALIVMGKNPIVLVETIWSTLIYPFFGTFGERLATTVAENAQPYLTDLTAQIGKPVFYLFVLGLFFIGLNFIKEIKHTKYKPIGMLSWIAICFGILFSRSSASSLLNGSNFISQAVYLTGVLFFFAFIFFIEKEEKLKLNGKTVVLIAIAIAVMINARAAVRSFFLITPFISLIAGYSVYEIISSLGKAKDETLKYILWAGTIIVCLLVVFALFGFASTPGIYQISSNQAKYVGPSANDQWQNAMAWTRNNTSPEDIFVHWWDYGYFVQTFANRPTVTDGGHAAGSNADYSIGRYVLTTPIPATAFSYMKTWNVSYLLIDPTDMGKYGAFSKIGSNDSYDRISTGPISGATNSQNTQETATGITKIYNLGSCVDGDISYNGTFLPGISVNAQQSLNCNSYIGGIILEMEMKGNTSVVFKQPQAVFIYNNKQYKIPMKNLYFEGKMISFGSGLDAVAYIIPSIDTKGQFDETGAVIYLSPRIFNSLLGRVYILNDYYKEYVGLTLANKEDDAAVKYFSQYTGGKMNEFIYYQGLRAPLKIWKVTAPAGTQTHSEFLNPSLTNGYSGQDRYFQ